MTGSGYVWWQILLKQLPCALVPPLGHHCLIASACGAGYNTNWSFLKERRAIGSIEILYGHCRVLWYNPCLLCN